MNRRSQIARALLIAAWAAAHVGCSNAVAGRPAPAAGAPDAPTGSAPVSPGPDARDRQFEIMAEAVMAMREELAKSYEHSQQLTQEVTRLQSVAAWLRKELAKSRGQNGVLRDRMHALEKKLLEISPPPPAIGDSGAPAGEARPAPKEARRPSEQPRVPSSPPAAVAPAPAANAERLPPDPLPGDAGGG